MSDFSNSSYDSRYSVPTGDHWYDKKKDEERVANRVA